MNQEPRKTEKKPKSKSQVEIRDLKPKKDVKGGEYWPQKPDGTNMK